MPLSDRDAAHLADTDDVVPEVARFAGDTPARRDDDVRFTTDEAYEIAAMLKRAPPGSDRRPLVARRLVLERAAGARHRTAGDGVGDEAEDAFAGCCRHPGPTGCGSCPECERWGDDAYHAQEALSFE